MKKIIIWSLFCLLGVSSSFAQPKLGIGIGDKAPELTGSSINGESFKLSDTNGQLVLLDFWASWCGPCRRENPVVVDAWNKYKSKNFQNGKGFTVFSVSLDRSEEAWKTGILVDKLDWKYHISDLKGWYSKHAAVYGIRRIPDNFLIDGDGVIIARKLKGAELEKVLEQLVK